VIPRWRFGDPLAPLQAVLARGGVLVIPTESSYGLAVDPRNRTGVEAVYRIKGRDAGKALPVVVADRGQLGGLGIDPDLPILKPLSACWPGPLTVVLPLARPELEIPAAAGEGTLAVRVPGHAGLRRLLRALGHGLTATSANRAGEPPLTDPGEVAIWLETGLETGPADATAMIVDDGILPGGLPSTVVAIDGAGPVVLRAGSFPVERLRGCFMENDV
jgi:L-threonylcarbamoyladenylate synthase